MALVRDFENGTLDIHRLSIPITTLITQESNAKEVKNLRPISLHNCGVKFFTKGMTTWISHVSKRLILPNQTAFIRGRFILESAVMAHEVIHEIHTSNSSALVLKLDYDKTYRRVSWDFLMEIDWLD